MADAESRLYQDLKWAGLQWDEGMEHAAIDGGRIILMEKQVRILEVLLGHTSRYIGDVAHIWMIS